MVHTLKNKKGVSMAELIAYVALYGVVMSLLASLVFVIVNAARKVNAQSILNRGATIMYTEILSETVSLNPDYVPNAPTITEVTLPNGQKAKKISIYFEKVYYYTEEGDKKLVKDDPTYVNKTAKITYSYTEGEDKILATYYGGSGTKLSDHVIDLDYKMTITSHDDGDDEDDISGIFNVDKQNESNKYVTFHGDLHYDNKKMEFKFIIPVFTYRENLGE